MKNLRALGIISGASVLVVVNSLAFLYAAFSYLLHPTSSYDFDLADGAWWLAALGAFLAAVSVLLTVLGMAATRWFTAYWLIFPLVILVAAVVRAVYIADNYPLTTPDQ